MNAQAQEHRLKWKKFIQGHRKILNNNYSWTSIDQKMMDQIPSLDFQKKKSRIVHSFGEIVIISVIKPPNLEIFIANLNNHKAN